MESVHAPRRELDHERAHEAGHRAVHGRDGGRAGIGPVAGEAAVDEDGRVAVHLRQQRVDRLGVADHLERHEPHRRGDVVVLHRVAVPLDRREDEELDVADVGEPVADRLRLGEIEADPARRAADLLGAGGRGRGVATREHDVAAPARVELRELAAEAARPADDDDAPACHALVRGHRLRAPLGQKPALRQDVVARLLELPDD